MEIRRIEGATKILGAPEDWDQSNLKCFGLPIKEVVTENGLFMVSAWEPSVEELRALINGETIKLWVRGTSHPVVAISVGPVPG